MLGQCGLDYSYYMLYFLTYADSRIRTVRDLKSVSIVNKEGPGMYSNGEFTIMQTWCLGPAWVLYEVRYLSNDAHHNM